MTPALIGLLGVIAGGLLGGLVTYRVDRRKDKDKAMVGARLIIPELKHAVRSLQAAAGDPKNKAWPTAVGPNGGRLLRDATHPPAPPVDRPIQWRRTANPSRQS